MYVNYLIKREYPPIDGLLLVNLEVVIYILPLQSAVVKRREVQCTPEGKSLRRT